MHTTEPTWKPFDELMQRHIYHVLVVTSDYDRFLIEEDGHIEETLFEEYTELGLSTPPTLTFASGGEEALALVQSGGFDLVVTMVDLDEKLETLCASLKAAKADLPVIVLSPTPAHPKAKSAAALHGIDYLFSWQGNPKLFLAMIKLVEDRMNLEHDTSVADVQAIILIEDSVRFASSYLPLMYTCLIDNNNSTMLEALNSWGKHLRMRGRPKILWARSWEEAASIYDSHPGHILGVISDISFPKDGEMDKLAGFEFGKRARKADPELPIALQSSDLHNQRRAWDMGFAFLWKQSPTLLSDLYDYMNREYGFGPFIFRSPVTHEEVARARTMKELQDVLPSIAPDVFSYHSGRNDFSRWLRAQGLFSLARKVHVIKLSGNPEETRKEVLKTIRDYRQQRSRRTLITFDPQAFDETTYFSRIGGGSLGGKGRALAFIDQELRDSQLMDIWKDCHLSIPPTVVLCTDLFTRFLETYDLITRLPPLSKDSEVDELFLSYPLEPKLLEDLARILAVWKQPLAVRSSSLLEDSHYQPFAGVYDTRMIPNTGSDEERLLELGRAIRLVWASTFHFSSRSYLASTEHMLEEEAMAVVIQPVVGAWHGTLFYPTVGGVARSLDFWPQPGSDRNDGVAQVAFGLGKTVVDGGVALRFSPAHPGREMPQRSQESFYALDAGKRHVTLHQVSEADPMSMIGVASVMKKNGVLSENVLDDGHRLVTFHGILQYDSFPMARIIRDLLKLGEEAMASPVEIEFAIELSSHTFTLLQIRPMAIEGEDEEVRISDAERQHALFYARKVIGGGLLHDIHDLVVIDEARFERSAMASMALELEKLTKEMEGRPFILAAYGRIGSSDSWLGIPVVWGQIAGCRALVELEHKGLDVDPSQGAHFFQNLTSLGSVALTVSEGDYHPELLKDVPPVSRTSHFLHYRFGKELVVKVDARRGEAVVVLP